MTPRLPFHERIPVWTELDKLLENPEFDQAVSGIAGTYRRLQIFGRVLGPALEVRDDPARLLAGMEWAGQVDAPLMLAAMVHYGPVTTALRECGHADDDLDALAAELNDMKAPGAFVFTELGRGSSHVTIRTEARYHRDRHTFTLHTPDDAALKIMPHVGWTGLPRAAVVIARLLVDGEDRGVHAFAFRFPHPLAPTATLPGSAPVPLDYSVIRFDGAEVPYGYWLRDTAAITPDGMRDPLTPAQRLARSTSGANAARVCVAVAMSAAARATVAITARFNRQRVAGNPTMPLLDYVTHRTELASALARVYAITALTEHVGRCYVHDHEDNAGTGDHDPEATSYAQWASSNRDRMLTKAIATETLESVAAASRRLCGAHGVLHANRISLGESMARSFHSVAGDNRLLLLETAKHLLAHGPVSPPVRSQPDIGLGDDGAALHLVCLREQVLTERLRRHHSPSTDWNPHLLQLEELARVHATRRILQEFGATVGNSTGPHREALVAVHRLHGLDTLLDSAAWHLDHGTMRPGDLDVLQHARAEAADEVHRHLDHLVDGLTVPPGRVGGFIGQDDYIHRVAAILP